MTDKAISPLRRRMTEDMTVRGFTPCTQRGYLAAVENFTAFFGRSPDQASAEEAGHGNFGQLERDVPAMADNFGTDLD